MILWHYCPRAAFYSIIQSKTIRINDVSHSSTDPKELIYTYELTEEVCEKLKGSFSAENLEKLLGLYQANMNHFAITLALSVSEDGNLPNQWDEYADKGKGACIGLDLSGYENGISATYLGSPQLILAPVSYDREFQKLVIEKIIRMMFSLTVNEIGMFAEDLRLLLKEQEFILPFDLPLMINEQRDLVVTQENARNSEAASMLLHLSRIFKDPDFSAEKERRLIAAPLSKPIFAKGLGKWIDFGVKKHLSEGAEVQHLELELIDRLVAIRLGPNSRISSQEAQLLLEKHGFQGVSIDRSKQDARY